MEILSDFERNLNEEIEGISIDAKSRGFGVSKQVLYKTDFTTLIVHAFHIPKPDGTIHHFDLKINKYKRRKKSDPWQVTLDELEQDEDGSFQSLKVDSGNGEAVKKLGEFLNAQFEAIGQKIEKKKVIIDNPEDIDLTFVKYLNAEKLKNIDSLVSISRLENALKIWEENKDNDQEEFWQKLFQEHNWILSQLFACPFVHIGSKFYCGGKEDDDRGGVKGDLLYRNNLTENLAFIEIKTPQKPIVGVQYRGEDQGKENVVYSMSTEITGGTNQVLNQRKVYIGTHGESTGKYFNNAKCILIIGKIDKLTPDQCKSFELHRSSTREVEIITFDELFGRIKNFIDILKN